MDDPSKSASVEVTVLSIIEVSGGEQADVSYQPGENFGGPGLPWKVLNSYDNEATLSVDGVVGGDSQLGTLGVNPSEPPGEAFYYPPSQGFSQTTFLTLAATSVADPAISAIGLYNAYVLGTVVDIRSNLNGAIPNGCLSVTPGKQLQLVVGPGDPAGSWSVDGLLGGDASVGTIEPTAQAAAGPGAATYTAPQVIPSPDSVTVSATDLTNSAVSGSVSVTVADPATDVSVSPGSASIPLGGTKQFVATVTGGTDASVTWLIEGLNLNPAIAVVGGNSTLGTISNAGAYSAPTATTVGAVNVVAISNAGCIASPPVLLAFSNFMGPQSQGDP